MRRVIYLSLGWIAVGLGLIGIVLPVLPTTPFMILAAFLFTNGSPRARAWLVGHTHFGPHIRNWEANGAIAPRAKLVSVVTMGAVLALSLIFRFPVWVLVVQAACMVPAALFIVTRPDPR